MLFSIVTPIFNPNYTFLERAIDSINSQIFDDWEWILVDDGSTEREGVKLLESMAKSSNRIHLFSNERNEQISYSTNRAISNSSGKWIIFFDQDDLLHRSALSEISSYLRVNRELKVLYTDENKVDEYDQHYDPYCKPDWNPALLNSQNYFCHLLAVEKNHLVKCGRLRIGYEGSQDWELCLRLTANLKLSEVGHVPQILYHWRSHNGSTAKSVEVKGALVKESSKKTLLNLVASRGWSALIEEVEGIHWNIKRQLPINSPSLLLLILQEESKELDDIFTTEFLEQTDYAGEITTIILKNVNSEIGYFKKQISKIQILSEGTEFEYICLCSSKVKPIKSSWLSDLVAHAVDYETGFCGPKFVNVDQDVIVSGGLVAGKDKIIKSLYESSPRSFAGDKNRAKLQQNFTFMHPACVVGRKDLFPSFLDPFSVSSIMEACLSLHLSGLRNLWVPGVELDLSGYPSINFDFSNNVDISEWFKRVGHDPSFNPNLILTNGLPQYENSYK